MRKLIAMLLVLVMALGAAGCSNVGDIAASVADAAKQELENQVKTILEKNKVELVEMKTAFGELNDDGGKTQFFCAALIRCESEKMVQECVKAMDVAFKEAGMAAQSGSKVENEHLQHKEIVFDHSDFSDGTYYTVYGYTDSLVGGK